MTITVKKKKKKSVRSHFQCFKTLSHIFWKFLPERSTNQVLGTILNNYLGQTFAGTKPFGKPRKKKDQKNELKWSEFKIYDRIFFNEFSPYANGNNAE